MEWLYLMKWSYKKFLYLRLELFLILNEWLQKRPFRLWDGSPNHFPIFHSLENAYKNNAPQFSLNV